MGCTTSKEALRDRRHSSPTPYHRTYSAPVRRRTNHVVSLTSTTIGYLKLDRSETGASSPDEETMKSVNDPAKAKAWSEMIERRFPKTPPSEEPETINAWELMAGLDDVSPLRPRAISGVRSFSFNELPPVTRSSHINTNEVPSTAAPVPSIVSELNPETEVSPQKLLLDSPKKHDSAFTIKKENTTEFTGIVKARVTEFQQRINSRRNSSIGEGAKVGRCLNGGEGKVVFYFTSLRGIRKTYEDCWMTMVIVKGYGVKIDERDVSMHAGFKEELSEALAGGVYTLPKVFVDGMYLGGAEEVRRMHESGELGAALEGCEMVGKGEVGGQCEGCGDVRFVPCGTCSGSCKVYVEDVEDDEEEDEEQVEGGGGFRRCEDCNENGLVRCPICY